MAKGNRTSGFVAWMNEDVINRDRKFWIGRRNNKLCFGYFEHEMPTWHPVGKVAGNSGPYIKVVGDRDTHLGAF